MFRTKRGRLQTCMFATLLIGAVIVTWGISGPVTHTLAKPTPETWRRAWRNIGGGTCEKCDSPSASRIQYAAVTVYESRDGQGRIQGFYEPGKYRADQGQLRKVGNDTISSVRVERGYRVRLCQSEGNGDGTPPCQDFAEGQYNVSDEMDNQTSFIWVWRG
jgi:hypothetical protein